MTYWTGITFTESPSGLLLPTELPSSCASTYASSPLWGEVTMKDLLQAKEKLERLRRESTAAAWSEVREKMVAPSVN